MVTLRVPCDVFHSLTRYVSQNNLDMTVPLVRLRRTSGTAISRFFGSGKPLGDENHRQTRSATLLHIVAALSALRASKPKPEPKPRSIRKLKYPLKDTKRGMASFSRDCDCRDCEVTPFDHHSLPVSYSRANLQDCKLG